MTSPLTRTRVAPLLPATFGREYRHLQTCRSTQDELRDTDTEGTIVVSEQQSAGRGRRGHAWEAPPGRALLCSVLLRPPATRAAAELSLVAGVVVATTLERHSGIRAEIKWPNDVLVERAKIAGILAEAHGSTVALGIGLNVNQLSDELPRDTTLPPTSLRILAGQVIDRAPLLATLIGELETCYRAWVARGLSAIASELASRDALRGQRVTVGDVSGVGAGFDDAGALIVQTTAGPHSVVAGEVTVAW